MHQDDNDDTKKSNVLPMPRKRIRKVLMQQQKEKWKNRQKNILSGAILSVLAIVSVMNQKILTTESVELVDKSRGVASVKQGSSGNSIQEAFQHRLNLDIAESIKKEQAKTALNADLLDQLRFGLLNSNYEVLSTPNGEIYRIVLRDGHEPVEIKNHQDFLSAYASLFHVKKMKFELVAKNQVDDSVQYEYKLSLDGKEFDKKLKIQESKNTKLLDLQIQ